MADYGPQIKFGIWKKEKNGKTRLAGKCDEPIPEGSYFNVFVNERKKTDSHPDYNVVVNCPRGYVKPGEQGDSAPAGDKQADIPL